MRLADGNALVRVAIAAAVTVPNTWSITDYGRRLESSITGCRVQPAAPGPGPGLRVRRRLHPARRSACPSDGVSSEPPPATAAATGGACAQLVADFGHQLPAAGARAGAASRTSTRSP